jgi:hypothetical protein
LGLHFQPAANRTSKEWVIFTSVAPRNRSYTVPCSIGLLSSKQLPRCNRTTPLSLARPSRESIVGRLMLRTVLQRSTPLLHRQLCDTRARIKPSLYLRTLSGVELSLLDAFTAVESYHLVV